MSSRTDTKQQAPSRGSKRRKEDSAEVRLSKKLSAVLRHKALDYGLEMADDGYVSVSALLALKHFSGVSFAQICDVVWSNEKKRFQLLHVPSLTSIDCLQDLSATTATAASTSGVEHFRIRAVQGHTINTLKDEALLTIVDEAWLSRRLCSTGEEVFLAYHGTYRHCLDAILAEGLKTMGRNHIHFANAMPEANTVLSGMRSSCEVVIVVDVCRLVRDGVAVFVSQNGVILTRGVGDSDCLPSTFFREVLPRDGRPLHLPTHTHTTNSDNDNTANISTT